MGMSHVSRWALLLVDIVIADFEFSNPQYLHYLCMLLLLHVLLCVVLYPRD